MLESCKPIKPGKGTTWVLHCDGATMATNPSDTGGAGYTVWANGKLYYAHHLAIVGEVTGNLAEFIALHNALTWCHTHFIGECLIRTDSNSLVTWFNGGSKLTNPKAMRLAAAIKHLMQFIDVKLEWVSRDTPQQSFTDMLSKLGFNGEGRYQTKESHEALLNYFYSGVETK
jgi:ribonuclease HI